MSLLLGPFIDVYRYALAPVAPFTWFGLNVTSLDLAATFRLCLALRQLREDVRAKHIAAYGPARVEPRSFIREVVTTLTVVYGGEAVVAPLLGTTPSFMVSGVFPTLYILVQALIEYIPVVPSPSLQLDLPLSVLDGFTRAFLLCNLIPPAVTANASPIVASSPWTLLISSLVIANGGFFITGLTSLLSPTSLALSTPSEMLPYGWTTTDLWCAPLITGVYALLTHAQPFWEEAHNVLSAILGGAELKAGQTVEAVDAEVVRAACAAALAIAFSTRTMKNFRAARVVNNNTTVSKDELVEKKTQ